MNGYDTKIAWSEIRVHGEGSLPEISVTNSARFDEVENGIYIYILVIYMFWLYIYIYFGYISLVPLVYIFGYISPTSLYLVYMLLVI